MAITYFENEKIFLLQTAATAYAMCINDFDFTYCLEAGDTYETAKFIAGYLTEGGFGGVGRRVHRYECAEIIHPMERDRVLPIIYNTHSSFTVTA